MVALIDGLRGWWRRLAGAPAQVPESLWAGVEATLPFLDFLSNEERAQLRGLAREFLAHKQFHGASGLELTDRMLLSIALQACLPILHIGLDAYRGWVGVVVYPGGFIIPRSQADEAGVVHEYDDEVLGEAWAHGPVLIGWDIDETGDEAADGLNVVIHEFVHKLDMLNGEADGLPPLPAGMSRTEWARVFTEAYDQFCELVDSGLPTVLDPYAAEHPAEFFAVASETFFEAPHRLQTAFPEVYGQLSRFYRMDPAARATHSEPYDGARIQPGGD